MIDDCGGAVEYGDSLGLADCAAHGSVTILGYRRNGEVVAFQASAEDMATFAMKLLDHCGAAAPHLSDAPRARLQ